MIPLIPLAIVGMGVLALRSRAKQDSSYAGQYHGILTPERTEVYNTAMNKCKDPAALNAIAGEFEKQGLHGHAIMLRKRANIPNLPPEQVQAYRQAYQSAIKSNDSVGVKRVAAAFHGEGMTGSAEALYKYAAGIDLTNTPQSPPDI